MMVHLVLFYTLVTVFGPGLAYWIDVEHLQSKREIVFCNAPPSNISATTLDLKTRSTFPNSDYQRALKRLSSRKELKKFLSLEEKRLENSLRTGVIVEYMPACLSKRLCQTEMMIADRMELITNSGLKCWNIQPVLVTLCEYSCLPDDFSCVSDDNLMTKYGYKCLPDYNRELLWFYCDTPDNPIRIMPVYIPFKCSAYRYCCNWESSPVIPRCPQ